MSVRILRVPAVCVLLTVVSLSTSSRAQAPSNDWPMHGRTEGETRFSPLSRINADTAKTLGLAWSFDTDTTRGLEATPIVTDGVLYTTGSWSVVFAIDARTGKLLWKWDPEVPRAVGGEGLLRRRQPRRRRASRPRLRRHARRPARVARRRERQGALADGDRRPDAELHHHRRPAHRQGQGDHRKRRRRVRRARLRVGVRRRHRQAGVALLHGPGRSRQRASSRRRWSAPRRRGPASGGSWAAAAPSGIRSPTIRSSTCSTSAPATGLRGINGCAALAAATTCTSRRSSRCGPTRASWCGTTRRRRAKRGTTRRRST